MKKRRTGLTESVSPVLHSSTQRAKRWAASIPAAASSRPRPADTPTYAAASQVRSSRMSPTASLVNVEKVVYAPRKPAAIGDIDGELPPNDAELKGKTAFDHDATEPLNERTPLALWMDAAKNDLLPKALQAEVARAAWVRAVLLGDAASARTMAARVAQLSPELAGEMRGYAAVQDPASARFYAVFLMLEDAIKLVWGVESRLVPEPYSLPGNFEIGALVYPVYNLLLIAVAVLTGLALAWALYYTRQGKLLLAVIHDREISAAMGINVDRVYLVTFTLGAMLAGLGGALTAPMIAVSPGIGVEVIVLSFAVVVIGGLGSLGGAALGALLVGLVRSIAVRYWPEGELFIVYFVMALVLIVRPKGLFSQPEARRI